MPNTTRTFSLQFCSVSLGGLPPFTGYAEGDAMTLEYPNDDFEMQQSSDGQVIWVQKHNAVADVVIRLGQGNPLTALVRQLHEASLAAGGITYDFNAVNLKSADERAAGKAMIKKRPAMKWSDSAQPVEIMLGLTASVVSGGTILPT